VPFHQSGHQLEEEMKTADQTSLSCNALHGIVIFVIFLSVFGAWDLPSARAQEVPKSVDVRIGFDRVAFGAGDDVIVQVSITNPNSVPVWVLKWLTPSEGVEGSLFAVMRDGVSVDYYGKLVKRAAPTASDYIQLQPGDSLTNDVNLSDYYDLSVSGVYQVMYNVASAALYEKALSGQSQDTDRMVSNIANAFIEGRAKRSLKELIPELLVTGATSFVGCSTSRQTTLTSARNNASTYAADAVTYLASGNTGSRYTTWFGTYNASRYSTVYSHFTSIQNAMDTQSMTLDCSTCTNSSWYAYVYANSPYTIYLCGAFWSAPATGTDSQAGTLIHETTHFNVVAGTSDYVYGQDGAKALAISNPANAIMNADNHEYFAENNPPSCPDLYSFDGHGWVNNGSIYKATHSPLQESYQELLLTQRVMIQDNFLRFAVMELDNETSFINSIDMYYRNEGGTWTKLLLSSAIHRQGYEMSQVLNSKDDSRAYMAPGDWIMLAYGIPPEGVTDKTEYKAISSGYYLWSAETWCQILSIGPRFFAKPGAVVELQAMINNMSTRDLPDDAILYFDIHGVRYTSRISTFVGSLAPGRPQNYSLYWTVPDDAPSGEYSYSVSIYIGENNITFGDVPDQPTERIFGRIPRQIRK
jgi:peptidyl-Lys metalloendopeptidase